MIYLYIGTNTVKLLSLSKTLLGQYNISHFAKNHSSNFMTDGKIAGVDLIASAVKEALTSAKPNPVNEKDTYLILPQDFFTFGRYTVPSDVADDAIMPFIKDKVKADIKIDIEQEKSDFFLVKKDSESTVFFYAIKKDFYDALSEIMTLLQLKLIKILPETLAYYKLFDKTLRKEKKEKILYANYGEKASFAYLYDSFGLLKDERFTFGEDIKPGLKKQVAAFTKEDIKLNRLILSGTQSSTVRQDLFTKDVGAWTNPLEKIIDNFYQDYLKMILPNEETKFPVLQFDMCFGAFIFVQENRDFSMMKGHSKTAGGMKRPSLPRVNISIGPVSEIFSIKTLIIFVISFILSFGIIFGVSNMSSDSFSLSLPSFESQDKEEEQEEPTATPSPEPSPTPEVAREELKVKILNGSGIKGKAAEIKEVLQDAGYTDIVVGNADNFDYETSEIQIKEDSQDVFGTVKEDLIDFVEIEEATDLDEEETADIVFIFGADIE